MTKGLKTVSDLLDRLARICAVPLVGAFFLLIFWGVVTRFVLRRPMLGIEDYSKTCFVWSCFLGAAILVKRREHIAITGIVQKLPATTRLFSAFIIDILSLAFFVYVMYIGIRVTNMVHVTRMVSTGMRMSVLYSALPVSMALCAVHALANLASDVVRTPERGKKEVRS